MAHAIAVDTMGESARTLIRRLGGANLGRYRWRCSCGRIGPWREQARSARNGGQRHQAAMEKR